MRPGRGCSDSGSELYVRLLRIPASRVGRKLRLMNSAGEHNMAVHHNNAILALVDGSHASRGLIEALYWKELERLEPARVQEYLPLVTSRRVRDLLRKRESPI